MNLLQIHTQEELDTAAQALAESWGKSFAPGPKFDGKKKSALRDVVLRLAGYPNGYQQWKAHHINHPSVPTNATVAHLPSVSEWVARVNALPSTLLVLASAHDLSAKLLVGSFHPEHERALGTLHFQMSHEDYPDQDLWPASQMLTLVPVWIALTQRYIVSAIDIELPNIEEYGVPDVATDNGAIAFVENLGFNIKPGRTPFVVPHNLGDDGSALVFITLTAID